MLLYFVISVTVPAAASDVALIALQALQNPLALPFALLLSFTLPLLFSLSVYVQPRRALPHYADADVVVYLMLPTG